MNDDISKYIPSLLNPRCVRKEDADISLTQNSIVSRCSLSLKRNNVRPKDLPTYTPVCTDTTAKKVQKTKLFNKENADTNNADIITKKSPKAKRTIDLDYDSLGFSAVDDINSINALNIKTDSILGDIELSTRNVDNVSDTTIKVYELSAEENLSSTTDLLSVKEKSVDKYENTIEYNIEDKSFVNVSFGIFGWNEVDVKTEKSHIKKVKVTKAINELTFDCQLTENTEISTESEYDYDENMNETSPRTPLKRSAITVNLEIKKKKLTATDDSKEKTKVLILKTDAIEKLSHVILQPPNYKLKRQILFKSKSESSVKKRHVINVKNGKTCDRLKQKSIDCYFNKTVINKTKVLLESSKHVDSYATVVTNDDNVIEMNKTSAFVDISRCDRNVRSARSTNCDESPKSARLAYRKSFESPRKEIKGSSSEAQRLVSPRKHESIGSHSASPRRTTDSIQFNLAQRKPLKSQVTDRSVPQHKIVAGTHFAVDAFAYGDIPNVKHYFLTHFHSDHYAGLRKGFNKLLICSKITADLCTSRLGVSPKCIHVVNMDEPIKIDGVEIMPLDANHCPGAIMLVFTLPNGKTILHTGDFRASPNMESYPVFWNREIHTVYLDTTYCNPRYDFPTQDQSLEMALYILRQKKQMVEQAGKSFASVLIVCGTYTIGKERFFVGMSRRVGCSVWACPEKDRVLQLVEGASFSTAPPAACQLHVVPMRDLTHDKLRCYLDSLGGSFSEVVAFKPSGWENGKHAATVRDQVTIHGIPYSEHSSFSELIRFVKFLKPKQVVPTVDIPGGIKTVQKYFPCPLVCKEDVQSQSKVTDYFSIQGRQQVSAVT